MARQPRFFVPGAASPEFALAAAPGLGEHPIEHFHHYALLGARQPADALHLLLKFGRLATGFARRVR